MAGSPSQQKASGSGPDEENGDGGIPATRRGKPGADIEAIVAVIRAIRTGFHRLGVLADEIHESVGVTGAMRAVMESLYESGPRSVPQIARSKSVSRQHIQVLVDQLAESGQVAMLQNPDHRRSPLITLTRKGRRLFEQMQGREQALLSELVHAVPARGLMVTLDTLLRMNEEVERLIEHQIVAKAADEEGPENEGGA